MDAKITKNRLSIMLSYDWLKIVGAAVAAIFFWLLVLTMTATRITPAQQFTVYNYACNNRLSDKFLSLYTSALNKKTFSYEVIEVNEFDLAENPDYAYTLLEAHTAVEEGDLMFVPNVADSATAYKEEGSEETKYGRTYAESFFSGYHHMVYELDPTSENSYFKQMENFLNRYYTQGYQNAEVLDTAKIEQDFVARITKNGDKRFKTDEQIAQGKKAEIERLKKYRDALDTFLNDYLKNGVVELTELTLKDAKGNPFTVEEHGFARTGKYAINLCPNDEETTMKNLKEYLSYNVPSQTDSTKQTQTAKDMLVMFFDFDGVEESYQYESLLFVNQLIAKGKN